MVRIILNGPESLAPIGGLHMEIQQQLFEAIRRADRAAANALLRDWAAKHGCDRLLAEVLEPTLQRVGEEWYSSEAFTLAQAYVAAKIAEDALLQIANAHPSADLPQPTKGPVVIGNIEDDFHALGRRMVCTFLRFDGWIVHDLGNDVPPATFVDKALEVGARVIGVSAMMLTTAMNIRHLRQEIDRRRLSGQIQLAVGGAVFIIRPGLVEEVGGDGTARSAVGAPSLFADLWNRSVRHETQP
jgi:methanogenic corrinoid protein MtbC1